MLGYRYWTLFFCLVLLFTLVHSRPQDATTEATPSNYSLSVAPDVAAEKATTQHPRNVKNKQPVIGEAIKMVASQLLENINSSSDQAIVSDTRVPPKVKNQIPAKNKIKTRLEDSLTENGHAGIAVPVTLEELEIETKNYTTDSSTSKEGISTWILLSNPTTKTEASTEPTKAEEVTKKTKPNILKNKTKKPTSNTKVPPRQPVIASIVKSDLIAGGSAINDNVLNKIKDTVLNNVQKHKSTPTQKPSTESTVVTAAMTSEDIANEIVHTPKPMSTVTPIIVKITPKPTKKKNKNKNKINKIEVVKIEDSAVLPMEPKEQEIELEISTPAISTKAPVRTSSKKKKNKKRKTKPKPQTEILEVKSSNKTKSTKPTKTSQDSPITTQIYNYLSREVMPSVGVGVIGLAGLVGLASYFLYPFASPVRRTFEVDKKDDLYRHNDEEYANDGNGQAEEEMLGTVLAGMPKNTKNRLNPYIAQTPLPSSMYPAKKETDLRYRHVANTYDSNNYNSHYPQQKTGLAHRTVYSDQINYNTHSIDDNKKVYLADKKYDYGQTTYTGNVDPEPIYAASMMGSALGSGYNNDQSNYVVYSVKPSDDSDFKPVYPFEGQVFSETTNSPVTYPPTSMYLSSGEGSEHTETNLNYSDEKDMNEDSENKFVVGNVPKEAVESVTPAVVPEHGPRYLNRKRRHVIEKRLVEAVDSIIKDANKKDEISNEIEETPETIHSNVGIIESVSTLPVISQDEIKSTTLAPADVEISTKIYMQNIINDEEKNNPEMPVVTNILPTDKTDIKPTMTTNPTDQNESNDTTGPTTLSKPNPVNSNNVITYPPLTEEGNFFSFLRKLIEFKYRLGISILQTTSDSLNRYLRNMESSVNNLGTS